jgi:16S rRNA processing protein RimM
MEDTLKIGKTIKSFGKDGFIKVVVEDRFRQNLINSKYAFILVEGFLLPYFIESFHEEGDLIKFDEINSPQDARILSDTEIHLFKSDVTEEQGTVYEDELIGYRLLNQEGLKIGIIKSIIEMPMQVLLEVERNGEDILIPFHEDLVIGYDERKKIIELEIADGLLEL